MIEISMCRCIAIFALALSQIALVSAASGLRGGENISLSETVDRSLIIGGKNAVSGDYPYFAHFDSPGCGGSLIAPDLVLTAGHCKLANVRQYGTIYVGRHDTRSGVNDGAEAFKIVEDVRHPGFDENVCCGFYQGSHYNGVYNDFMIFKLSQQSSKPVISLNFNRLVPRPKEELHVIGFGDTHPGNAVQNPNRLHEVTVNYETNAQCSRNSIYPDFLLHSSSMCARDYREDACNGDSGGPLLIKGKTDDTDVQVGIVSWGWGCADQPGVYSRISDGYDWIRTQVCRMSRNPPASFSCRRGHSQESSLISFEPNPQPLPQQEAKEVADISPEISAPNRTLLSRGKQCGAASNSPDVCCSSISNRIDSVGQECVPAVSGPRVDGRRCQSIEWTLSNDPTSYQEDVCNKLVAAREYLPVGQACSSIENKQECCQFLDNRNDGSEYHGQPCVASKRPIGFKSGNACEPAIWVAKNQPRIALDCADLLPATVEADVEETVAGNEEEKTEIPNLSRTNLPEGRSCQSVSTLVACCLARDSRSSAAPNAKYRGQNCVPPSNGARFSSYRVCEPADWVTDNEPGSYDPNFCDAILAENREALPVGKRCDSLSADSPQDCCRAFDNRNDGSSSDGQPCLPARSFSGFSSEKTCEPADWVIENNPNNVRDCSQL